jgi:hypothetical protein
VGAVNAGKPQVRRNALLVVEKSWHRHRVYDVEGLLAISGLKGIEIDAAALALGILVKHICVGDLQHANKTRQGRERKGIFFVICLFVVAAQERCYVRNEGGEF